jgi:hypothetical protein
MSKRDPEYELLQTLDLLIDLREDMQDLGITTLEELEQKITELEAQLGDDDDGPV